MQRYFAVGKRQRKAASPPIDLSLSSLTAAPDSPIALRSLNELHDNIKQRIYRTLIPMSLLARFDINPISWKGPDRSSYVKLAAQQGSSKVILTAWSPYDSEDPFFTLELADSTFNHLNINWINLSDPAAERFNIDVDSDGKKIIFGTSNRNFEAEERAMAAGLAPGQTRMGLRAAPEVFQQIETGLLALGQQAITLESLTYVSAWIFERRGFAHITGHQLMRIIHEEFQPGGQLHAALDGSTPFRRPEQWRTVRGRAWAIYDGILDVIDRQWDDLRMIKQLGHHARVNSFPDAIY